MQVFPGDIWRLRFIITCRRITGLNVTYKTFLPLMHIFICNNNTKAGKCKHVYMTMPINVAYMYVYECESNRIYMEVRRYEAPSKCSNFHSERRTIADYFVVATLYHFL